MRREKPTKQVGGKVRPTTSKTLESLAAILAPRLEGAMVLDLFAGTGRVGLRLFEEGAAGVVFVEGHRAVAQDLRRLLRTHPSAEKLSLVVGLIPKVLPKIKGVFDIAVCDPPYDWAESKTLLPSALELVIPGGLLVVEHHHKTVYEAVDGWEEYRVEKYGESRLSFFSRSVVLSVHKPDDDREH